MESSSAVALVEEFVARRRQGETIGIDEFCQRKPESAAEIRALASNWAELESRLSPLTREVSLARHIASVYGDGVNPHVSLEKPPPETHATTPEASQQEARPLGRRYRRLGELARGGQGAIYRIWDDELSRHLAMKVVEADPEKDRLAAQRTVRRFLEEAQITSQLDHPGIVPVHEMGLDAEGRAYFTMKLVRGLNLQVVIDHVHNNREGWTQARALSLLLRVCEATAYAHRKGVIHRDLKPHNIMVGAFGEVFVMDWGMAFVRNHESPHPEWRSMSGGGGHLPFETEDGDVLGTPAYMSPQQARGRLQEVSPQFDVYSMGAILYHLLAGHPPYVPHGTRTSNYLVLRAVLDGPPQPIRELAPTAPADLATICEKAMARSLAQRYPSMNALMEDLRAYLEHRVVHAHESGALAEARKWVWRNPGLAAACVTLLLTLVAGSAGVGLVQAHGREAAEEQRQRAEAHAARAERAQAGLLKLSAFQRLQDLEERAERLGPARPENIPAFEQWLEEARDLVACLGPGPRGEPGVLTYLLELRLRALPRTPEREAADRAAHPLAGELARLEARLSAERHALEVREGRTPPPRFALDPAAYPDDSAALVRSAWARVRPDREIFGREAEGLAMAQLAFERAENSGECATALRVQAWAYLACGLDTKALEAADWAEAEDPERPMQACLADTQKLQLAIRARTGEPGRSALRALELERDELSRRLGGERRWRFADEGDEWWHSQMVKLVADIDAFTDPQEGLLAGVSPRFGPGIERRLSFARTMESRSISGAEARTRWEEAQNSIRNSVECPAYGGLDFPPQLGLQPIGRDPLSGLWEFAHLASGEAATRNSDGSLEMRPETGVVLVLIPGGTVLTGAQSSDPSSPHYDPAALPDERPSERRLRPFLISKFELTQAQWQRACGANPSLHQSAPVAPSPLHPVENVDWHDCMRVVTWLDLRLPYEAEWECAARGGTGTTYWSGDQRESLVGAVNIADRALDRATGGRILTTRDWPELDDGYAAHAPVTSFRPNPYGLHNVLGNVLEWCMDTPSDSKGNTRIMRGGSFTEAAADVRCARRFTHPGTYHQYNFGLRPARDLAERPDSGPGYLSDSANGTDSVR